MVKMFMFHDLQYLDPVNQSLAAGGAISLYKPTEIGLSPADQIHCSSSQSHGNEYFRTAKYRWIWQMFMLINVSRFTSNLVKKQLEH